ncbi:MAG: MurR/RpiR family transcriptional regulator [Anaerolineae bacterium]|nr:MurR/RpiR family transcriptional regulator [Anaerolineae bacterium]
MFQERIRENYDRLTPGFRKLADFLMNQTLDAAFLTATELSRRVGVDPATVVRFAQELNYSGYRELSREIKHYVRDQVTATYRKGAEAETEEELLLALVESTRQNLTHFVSTDLKNMADAIKILREASHIWVIGEYSSYDLANLIAKSLNTVGIPATAFRPGMVDAASTVLQMKEGEALLALVIAQPAVDTGYAVRLAKEKGVKTVCMTDSGVVLPAREADMTIITPIESPSGIPSFAITMLLSALLWEALAGEQAEKTAAVYGTMQEHMEKLRAYRSETPEYEIKTPQEA